jgi:hypothetical protein
MRAGVGRSVTLRSAALLETWFPAWGSGSKERAGRQLSGEVNGTRASPARRTRRFGLNQAPRTPVKSPAPH